jgi:hypothetical protein
MEFLSEGFKLEQTRMPKPTLRQVSVQNAVASKKNVTGSLEFPMWVTGWELPMLHAMGTVETTGSGTYTHAFALANNLPAGLTFNVNRDSTNLGAASTFQYSGCQITNFTITAEPEEHLKASIEIIGRNSTLVANETPTFPSNDYIFAWNDTTTITVLGAEQNVRRFEISLANALADDRYNLGARERVGLGRNAPREVTGSFDLEFDTLAEYAYFQNLTSTKP